MGSSPHARGTRLPIDGGEMLNGIIPACAGNTFDEFSECVGSWDHPRMRGEHSAQEKFDSTTGGSSPHARGTRTKTDEYAHNAGIIPACAGNTFRIRGERGAGRDHPRMRGEHFVQRFIIPPASGSSPHARGTLRGRISDSRTCGIIPACAGNTERRRVRHFQHPDHPRMRGEHFASKTASR